jgi:hypothetical protein
MFIAKNEKSFPGQYGLRFSDKGKFIFGDGLLQQGRSQISFG